MKKIGYKKRWVNIPSLGRTRLLTKKINVNGMDDLNVAKVKVHDIWMIFDIETEEVIGQGLTWTDCLNMVKSRGLLNQN
jgi:hypothetical protein